MFGDSSFDEFNIDVDLMAKKVLEAIAGFNKGEFVTGEQIQKKTNLTPDEINKAVKVLSKALLINIPQVWNKLPPYEFRVVEITDLGRSLLADYPEDK